MDTAQIEGQRRQVTVLFIDMANFTPLAEKLGEEAVYTLMRQVIARMSEGVKAHQGNVYNLTGDGLMALFGAPTAIEDSPLKACRAALEIQMAMRQQESETEARYGVRPKFRVGLHTGPIVIGRLGHDDKAELAALGDTVNLAARLQAEAEPGGIVMSATTYRLVDGYVQSLLLGERTIKGKSAPMAVYRLDGLKAAVSRFDLAVNRGLTSLVGRSIELDRLQQCWKESRAGQRVVNIIGEAGLGKSRLVHEFRQRIEIAEAHFLQGRCSSSGASTPFLPFIDIVNSSFRITADSTATDAEQRLSRGLELMGIGTDETLPYLLNLLGHTVDAVRPIDSEMVGVRTRHALQTLLRERRRISPVVLFIDDLHWVDGASRDLLQRICAEDSDLPLLLICAFRPDADAAGVSLEGAIDIRLGQLSRDDTVALMKNRFGTDTIPEDLMRLVLAKVEGNPLFGEEIVNYLLDKGVVRKAEDAMIFDAGAATDLPVTVETLLMDRVDRLDRGARSALEAAAVTGASFSGDLIREVTGAGDTIAAHLAEIQRRDLIFLEPDKQAYRFKHALVREAVYKSILQSTRESLHERIAAAIERSGEALDGDLTDILAWHYGQTRNDEKAVHYLARAGQRSLVVYSLTEAETHLKHAIERAERAPGHIADSVLVDILLDLARVLYFRIDFYGIIALVDGYQAVVERLGDPHRLGRFLFETGYAHVFSGQHELGRPMLERALAIGNENGDDEIIGYASVGLLWYFYFWEAPTPEIRRKVLDYSATGFRIGQSLRDGWLAAKSLLAPALYFNLLGQFGEGRKNAIRLIEYGGTINDPRPRAMGLWALAYANATFNPDEAIANADESLSIGLNPIDQTGALCAKGLAHLMLRQNDEALSVLRSANQRYFEGGALVAMGVSEYALGVAMAVTGDLAGGVRWIEDWRKRWAAENFVLGAGYYNLFIGEIFLEMAIGKDRPSLHIVLRNLGFLLRTLPFAAGKARRHLEAACGFFRNNDMPGFVAWSLLDLGRLHVARKRFEATRACLDEARTLAIEVDEPYLVKKIDALAAGLPAR
jgi:class 3 adenylate cyclase/tetratricopeptide (TPR) repeat protein